MREGPDVLVNAHGGERVIVRRRPETTPDGPLELTLELPQPGAGPPEHPHPQQTEPFCLRRGALAVAVDGSERELRRGDECVIPLGAAHRWVVLEPGTQVELTVQPALRFEEVLERAFELADEEPWARRGSSIRNPSKRSSRTLPASTASSRHERRFVCPAHERLLRSHGVEARSSHFETSGPVASSRPPMRLIWGWRDNFACVSVGERAQRCWRTEICTLWRAATYRG
jgi:quercetin dioxygenase-like cupin family protein